MGKGKKEFKKRSLTKDKKVMVRFPRRSLKIIKKKIQEHELKSMQELFDCMIISGIVFRKKEILEFVRENVPKYQKISAQEKLSRLGKAEKPPKIDMYGVNMTMYNNDYLAFKNYIVEENIQQQWLWNILFEDGFSMDEPCIIDLVERAKKLEINSRKKAIARLTNDEYITTLSTVEADKILEKITEEYDNKKFDASLEAIIESKIELEKSVKNLEDEEDLDSELAKKMENLRRSRGVKIQHLTKPKEE